MSKRQERKQATGMSTSRCNRRASRRMDVALGAYQEGIASVGKGKGGETAFTKPGAMKRW